MNQDEIEVPYKRDQDFRYKLFEKMPAIVSYLLILMPIILSFISTTAAAYFIISYILVFFFRAVAMAWRVLQGYHRMQVARILDWEQYLSDVDDPEAAISHLKKQKLDKWDKIHLANLERYVEQDQKRMNASDVIHAVIIASYNESMDVLEMTVQSVIDSIGNHQKQTVLLLAYEERGGPEIKAINQTLLEKYGDYFMYAATYEHPHDIAGEVIGKGGNITYAARQFEKWIKKENIDPSRIVVTTLDSDNRPDHNYFMALSYSYILCENRKHKSFQPIPMYFTNIWDVPAPMRVIATGNSFWMVVTSMRPHLLRNFSAHAQPMDALMEMDYWSVRTIVEDGHQYWRSYFKFNGDYDVLPLYVPIHQDAVLSRSYIKTLRAQFIQLRRWAYGASDIPYVITRGYFMKNKVPRLDLLFKTSRLIDGHVSWASSAILIAFSGWVPLFFSQESSTSFVAQQLPDLVAILQRVATLGIFVTMYVGIASLPPRPQRVHRSKSILMIAQWILLPVTTIVYNTLAAINAQTRLLFGFYLDKFDVTDKAMKK